MSQKYAAVFEVKMLVTLHGVSDVELDNSEVLHPDVIAEIADRMSSVTQSIDTGRITINLEEAYEEHDD